MIKVATDTDLLFEWNAPTPITGGVTFAWRIAVLLQFTIQQFFVGFRDVFRVQTLVEILLPLPSFTASGPKSHCSTTQARTSIKAAIERVLIELKLFGGLRDFPQPETLVQTLHVLRF